MRKNMKAYSQECVTRCAPYHPGYAGAFFWMSKDIRMIDLNLRYAHGFGVLGRTSENITLDHVSFRAPEETGRTTAGYADFIQISGCKGKIKIENCYFANAHDDPINIHGTFQQVVAISDDRREIRVRYMHNETAGFPSFAPGDEVEFTSRSTMLPVESYLRSRKNRRQILRETAVRWKV